MRTVRIDPTFTAWRERARALLGEKCPPEALLWEDGSGGGSLFDAQDDVVLESPMEPSSPLKIPREFMNLAELVACHRAPERWGALYGVAWRLTHGNERHLLAMRIDEDLKRLEDWASAVRRDRHKMKAFVRFRKVGESVSGREQFVAWFEPDHAIVALTAPFFAKRFASMDWSILTPTQCAHWNGEELTYSPGVSKSEAPKDDVLEDYWRSYYAHIFNPARLKLDAMQSEMPKKYWKNLPEAPLIAELTSKAALREEVMVDSPASAKSHVSNRVPIGVPEPAVSPPSRTPIEVLDQVDEMALSAVREAAHQCQACPLHERATQVVFGQGPEDAEIMIVGEQPGDAEDLAGDPFVGPSGELLDDVLRTVGIRREDVYVTNTVKHFKWKREGKRRLHQSPSRDEVHVCRPWVLAEVLKVKPTLLVCLGATSARALIREDFALMKERGLVSGCELAPRVLATVHPSFLLRLPTEEARQREWNQWVADFSLALE